MATDTSPVHLTVSQAAAHAGVSIKTIRRWLASGRLTSGRAGLAHIIDQTDLERAMATVGQSTDSPRVPRLAPAGQSMSMSVVQELLDRLERQAGQLAALRLENDRLKMALGSPSANGTAETTQEPSSTKHRPWWRWW